MANTTSFDPFAQSFTLLMRDGTPFNVTIPDLDDFILYSVQISITYAAQLGASLVFLIVLLLLTKPDKRKSPVFILNTVALTLNFLRTLLHCLYYTGPFSEAYAYFGVDYSRVSGSDYASQVAITILTWFLLVCVELSLLLQVQVVCVTLRDGFKRLIFAFSAMIAGLALAFRLALCVENSKYILSLEPEVSLQWLASASNITTSISICWFCAVFVIKLGFALDQRRKLKVGNFRPMQIIFIMGCQTLIIPAIFSIIEYWVPLPSINSHVLTLVTIFLPLSSLWASASVDDRKRSMEQQMGHGKLLRSDGTATPRPLIGAKFLDSPHSPSATATTRTSNSGLPSPTKPHDHHLDFDLEAQKHE
ncbi:MAG: hypothetical protein Q9216_001560 [Gyalolechia sp. 2 TL-2023]